MTIQNDLAALTADLKRKRVALDELLEKRRVKRVSLRWQTSKADKRRVRDEIKKLTGLISSYKSKVKARERRLGKLMSRETENGV